MPNSISPATTRFSRACRTARLFVDDPVAPTAALLCRSYEYYPAGAVDPALRRFISDAPAEAEVFGSFYGYVPLERGLENRAAERSAAGDHRAAQFSMAAGHAADRLARASARRRQIVPVDRALAERLDRECYPVPFILYDWGSYEAYAAHGYGFALLIGEARSPARSRRSRSAGSHALINVATEPPFRRQGLATLVSACFVAATLERGLLPVWDADDTNAGSIALARRVGFTEAEPFVELALPDRAKPEPTRGIWSSTRRADGVIVWRRNRSCSGKGAHEGV